MELQKYTLAALIENSTKHFSTRPALCFVGEKPITYQMLGDEVRDLSGYLKKNGVNPGDKVILLSENKPNWVKAYFAITSTGAVVVPILPDFSASQVHHIIRHSGAKAIFVSDKLYEKIEDGKMPNLKLTILIDDLSVVPREMKNNLAEFFKESRKSFLKITNAAFGKKEKVKEKYEVQEDDVASIIYTSGTTGHSKGVMLTQKNLVANMEAGAGLHDDVNEYDRFLSILPLSHTYECTVGMLVPIAYGACIYYNARVPSPKILLAALASVQPTFLLSVPLVIEKIFKSKILPELNKNFLMRKLYALQPAQKKLHQVAGKKLYQSFGGHLKIVGIGGAKLSAETEKFLADANFPFAVGYGMTESSPLIASMRLDKNRFRSTGVAVKNTEIKIHNRNPKTGEGEIWSRGPSVMKGYYKDDELTAEVITEDGWLKTGDLGKIDEDGFLYILGRSKNMILGPSGENIYPEEIEALINAQNFVLESLVFWKNDQLQGRVHLDYEALDLEFSASDLKETEWQQKIANLLESLRVEVNLHLPVFSRLRKLVEQAEAFDKTPTLKIKRYLYVD